MKTMIMKIVVLLMSAAMPVAFAGTSPEIPAGTDIAVKVLKEIDSLRDNLGEKFGAVLAAPIKVGGEIVVPEGAPAEIRIVRVPVDGMTDAHLYALELTSLTINGCQYPVITGYAKPESGHRDFRTGTVPEGTTDIGEITAALGEGDQAAMAIVNGAGVSFEVLLAPRVQVTPNVILHFTLAELATVRPEMADPLS